MNLQTTATDIVTQIKDTLVAIAPLFIIIGLIGAGIMYAGSSLPILGDWKKENPKALTYLIIGCLCIAGVGLATSVFGG